MTHTPGPWQGCLHLRANADETCGCGYRGGIWSKTTDTMVCEMGGPTKEEGADMIPRGDRATQIADHWLIAAAPELLAALREACAIFDMNVEGDGFNDDLAGDLWKNDIHEKITAAIAKAEGRS